MGRYDEESRRREAESWRQDKKEGNSFKLKEGENIIRILKTPADDKRKSPPIWIEYMMHSNVGPNNRFVRCGKDLRGKGECWICDVLIPKLKKRGKMSSVAKLEPKPQFEVQVAIVDDDGNMRGPKRWFMSSGKTQKTLAYRVQGIISSRKRDYLDHKKGRNITITRTGTGRTDTTYEGPEIDDESSKVPKNILADLKPFVDVVTQYDEERQKNAYYGKEDDMAAAKKDSKKKKTKREDESPDESSEEESTDSSDESSDSSDESSEEPKKKGKGKKKDESSDESSDSSSDGSSDSSDESSEDESSEDESSEDESSEESSDESSDDESEEKPAKKGAKKKASKGKKK